ncbi:MAG: glycosyltransferase, partial [Gemmatimonadetes bacterium]|nr:glycosyltransferase [Gemmatimonadota bacterium]
GLRERLGLGPGPILLYAGHLGPASDLGPLLPALARVARAHPEGRLLVVGDGRERTRLEARAGQELPPGWARFVGTVVHAEVPAYFALADVALNFLEDTEANRHRASIKLREALAAGVPVVTSPTPDARRFAAWVEMPVGTGPDAFVDTLLATLARPERDRARAGQAWLAQHGTFDAAVRELAVRWEEGS